MGRGAERGDLPAGSARAESTFEAPRAGPVIDIV